MVVQHNLRAMNANRMLGITQGTLSKSAEKLSSGYKVNRAADDAAGLSISEKMRKQIRGLTQASLNAEDGISAVQTAEGALTEVHDMLQRMNELVAKAANGTNALSDRQTIQDEVDQLLTEIDRVAETTKFNETYLLKGDKDTVTKYVNAKDAGLEGTLSEGAAKATFTMNTLKVGDIIQIAGKTYTIGEYEKASDLDAPNTDPDTMYTRIKAALGLAQAGEQITLDGVQYTVIDDADTENADKNMLKTVNIVKKVAEGSHAVYKGTNYYAMKDSANPQTGKEELNGGIRSDNHANGIDDTNANVITAQKAYEMIYQELILANNIGTDAKAAEIDENTGMLLTNSTGKDIDGVTVNDTTIAKDDLGDHSAIDLGTAPNIQGQIKEAAYEYSVSIDTTNGIINLTTNNNYRDKISFVINKGQVNVKENLNFSLHVGADADMTNKIAVDIKALDTAGLGIKGLNVKDGTGASATYAIDSIADAIATVSSQRSLLGAVQNRLEHTINNLNNVVENTTAAESQIRDTDMATEMVKYSNANILSQAGQSMLAQGNQSNQGVLSLLG